jgi:hypothetical protein
MRWRSGAVHELTSAPGRTSVVCVQLLQRLVAIDNRGRVFGGSGVSTNTPEPELARIQSNVGSNDHGVGILIAGVCAGAYADQSR